MVDLSVASIVVVVGLFFLVYQFLQSQGSDSVSSLIGNADPTAYPETVRIAQAIANAEGFNVSGSRPKRDNNPGDMTADLIGKATGTDGSFVVYGSVEDGWSNLYAQVNAWLQGTSSYHGPDSTIADLAGLGSETGYTNTSQSTWAQNVATFLGVSVDTPLSAIGSS